MSDEVYNRGQMHVIRWFKKKSFHNWLVVLLIYLVIISISSSVMIFGYLVKDIKQLEDVNIQYQGIVTQYQNSINSALGTINKLEIKIRNISQR
jgi:predicted PurR-regulated permease PerM